MKPDETKKQNKITLTVVVNGTDTEVEANVNAPLHTIVPEALRETGNTGQPPENWRILDQPGNQLDPNRKIEEYHLISGTKLFLSLKEGVGG
jgi:Protein of Unknown function (DUF2604)